MSHALFLTLLHGRGAFRVLLRLGSLAGTVALFWLSVTKGHGTGALAHMGRLALQLMIVALVVGGWALRWRYDQVLRHLCPADTTLYLRV